jgi:toxin FitB
MKLFDSNLIIYAAKPYYASLRPLLLDGDSCVSVITKLEALGFHNLTFDDKAYLEGVFTAIPVIPINSLVIEQAILFRQAKKMSVGDAIIAATALLNGFDLYTNNTKDFVHITGLTVINPLDNQ